MSIIIDTQQAFCMYIGHLVGDELEDLLFGARYQDLLIDEVQDAEEERV